MLTSQRKQWSTKLFPGPGYPFLWGHPVVPIYGDISKNRHITAYGKDANIAFLVYARKTAKSYMMNTFSWDFKGEIMQQLIQFGRALKKIMMQGMSSNFSIQKN